MCNTVVLWGKALELYGEHRTSCSIFRIRCMTVPGHVSAWQISVESPTIRMSMHLYILVVHVLRPEQSVRCGGFGDTEARYAYVPGQNTVLGPASVSQRVRLSLRRALSIVSAPRLHSQASASTLGKKQRRNEKSINASRARARPIKPLAIPVELKDPFSETQW